MIDSVKWHSEVYAIGDTIEVMCVITDKVINSGEITGIELHKNNLPAFHFKNNEGNCFVAPYLDRIYVRKSRNVI